MAWSPARRIFQELVRFVIAVFTVTPLAPATPDAHLTLHNHRLWTPCHHLLHHVQAQSLAFSLPIAFTTSSDGHCLPGIILFFIIAHGEPRD